MSVKDVSGPKEPSYSHGPRSAQRDWSKAQSSYDEVIKELPDAGQRHAEVGILLPDGKNEIKQLGKQEEYGSHRVCCISLFSSPCPSPSPRSDEHRFYRCSE